MLELLLTILLAILRRDAPLASAPLYGSQGISQLEQWSTANGYLAPIRPLGVVISASSTIGNGTRTGGLTISGGSTTTGTAYFASRLGVGTTSPGEFLGITGNVYASGFLNTSGTTGGYKIDNNLILQASSTRTSIFGGQLAGNSGYTGLLNTAFGYNALHALTSGTELVAIGANALAAATSTPYDVAIGSSAMLNYTTPAVGTQSNIAIGRRALEGLAGQSFGVRNVAIGERALLTNTTGSRNMCIGYTCLVANTTGFDNVAVGYQALTANISGDSNIAIGSGAMVNATSSRGNTAVGNMALSNFTGPQNSTTEYNTAVGERAVQGAAGGMTGTQNTGMGQQVISRLTTGSGNVGLGYRAGLNVSTGLSNVLIGQNAAQTLTTGSYNTVLGMGFNGTTVDTLAAGTSNSLNLTSLLYGTLTAIGGGRAGIASTTPYAKLSVHAFNGETNTALFAVASSTASATTTHFLINNAGSVGIGTDTPTGRLNVSSGANATTTVSVGEINTATSKGCVNMNRSDGGAGSFYLNAAGTLVSEANYCR